MVDGEHDGGLGDVMGWKGAEHEAGGGGAAGDLAALRDRLDQLIGERTAIDLELYDVRKAFEELGEAIPPELVELDTTELVAKLSEAKLAHQRALADFQNYQRRALENERRVREGAAAGVIESMVNVLDTFEMARRMDPKTTSPDVVLQGIEMIRGEMLRVLGMRGFAVIEPKRGDDFDPNRHEAIVQVDAAAAADVPPGHVVDTMRAGYRLEERVIRPAQVSVRAGAEEQEGCDEEGCGHADV